MKNIVIFISGLIVGILITIAGAYVLTIEDKPYDEGLLGLTKFPEKGECITTKKKELEVLQVIEPNIALAEMGEFPDKLLVLLINYDEETYYDDQRIKIPANKCARQIGIYEYTAKMGMDKTVPAVIIE